MRITVRMIYDIYVCVYVYVLYLHMYIQYREWDLTIRMTTGVWNPIRDDSRSTLMKI